MATSSPFETVDDDIANVLAGPYGLKHNVAEYPVLVQGFYALGLLRKCAEREDRAVRENALRQLVLHIDIVVETLGDHRRRQQRVFDRSFLGRFDNEQVRKDQEAAENQREQQAEDHDQPAAEAQLRPFS